MQFYPCLDRPFAVVQAKLSSSPLAHARSHIRCEQLADYKDKSSDCRELIQSDNAIDPTV